MMHETMTWNYGILLAFLVVIMGTVGILSLERDEDRTMAAGLFLQGILLTCVCGSGLFHRAVDLQFVGLVVTALLIIQTWRGPVSTGEDDLSETDDPR